MIVSSSRAAMRRLTARGALCFISALLTLPSFAQNANYEGRTSSYSDNVPWLNAAKARIDQHRKANLTIRVQDQAGNRIPNATVAIRMTDHAFKFGTAVNNNPLFSNATYAQKVKELFNSATPEYELTWNRWDSDPQRAINVVDWLYNNGITHVHGAHVVWPGWNRTPSWVQNDFNARGGVSSQTAKTGLRQDIDEHIAQTVGHTRLKGRIDDWNVLNEPYTYTDLTSILGEPEQTRWFNLTKTADPNAKRFINDFNILEHRKYISAGGSQYFRLDTDHQQHFEKTIRDLLQNGGAIQGIGFQSHFFEWGSPTPPDSANGVGVWQLLERYAAIDPNLELQITEFDMPYVGDDVQAAFMRDFLTICFSHPRVTAFTLWGFWDGHHWHNDAPLFNTDWTEKPSGTVWRNLVYNWWWTSADGATNPSGDYAVRGFKGDYQIEASAAGVTRTVTTTMTSDKVVTVTITVPKPTATVKINFQPDGAAVPAGYHKDGGASYGNRGNNYVYGWFAADGTTPAFNPEARERNVHSDQRYDTLNHMQLNGASYLWKIAVPTGSYRVRIVAGDPSYYGAMYKINAEGVVTVNGTPTSANRFVEGTQTVTVSDGALTISSAPGTTSNKVCFIEITPL